MTSFEHTAVPMEKIKAALASIDPDCDRSEWFKVCAAVKSELGEDGRDICEEWSAKGASYNEKDFASTWRSIGSGGVGIATLFHIARKSGWIDIGGWDSVSKADLLRRAERKTQQEAIDYEQAKAAQLAARLVAAGAPMAIPYLERKQVAAAGLHGVSATTAEGMLGYTPNSGGEPLTGELLLAPIHKLVGGKLVLSSVELIDREGRKASLPGHGTRTGGFVKLGAGDVNERLVIVEGVATGLSVLEATGLPVFCALSCTNLLNVAKALRKHWPNVEIVVGADLLKDGSGPHPDAVKAAREARALLAVPVFCNKPGDDFNDLHQHEGADAVRRCVSAAKCMTRFTLLKGDELAASCKPATYLIDGVLEADSHGLMFGPSGSYKSFLALRVAHSICTGQAFGTMKVRRIGPVVYVCGEGQGGISRRLKAQVKKLGAFGDNLEIVFTGVDLADDGCMKALGAQLAPLQPVLVMFDTFAALNGGVDENNPSDVGRCLRGVRLCGQACGASTLIVHHSGKETSKGARGASNFYNDTDFVWALSSIGVGLEKVVDATTYGPTGKMKDGEPFSFHFKAVQVPLGIYNEDGAENTSLVIEFCAPEDIQAAGEKASYREGDKALAILIKLYDEAGGDRARIKQSTWYDAMKAADIKSYRSVAKRLIDGGQVDQLQGDEYRPRPSNKPKF
ncbi:AAA family ATPase [Pseudomonas vranovensis]|uniref:AAA family ATPase n=1 Tax=Pseudomonas vranovensis TaxID=321661 RepID=UPI00041920B7|nr:AAA family ATPase [Pseudomonas vranovensis]